MMVSELSGGRTVVRKAGHRSLPSGPYSPLEEMDTHPNVGVSFVKGKFGCYMGHTAKGYIAGDRQRGFPKEVTIKTIKRLNVPGPGGT